MSLEEIGLAISALLLIGVGFLIREIVFLKRTLAANTKDHSGLQLQAYERLTVFAERSGLKNLISRSETFGESAALLHAQLITTLKSEYDYNVSQQIYVSKEVWEAVTRLKDQNIYIINQIAGMLPPQATSLDLSKRVLEYSMNQNAELSTIVLDAIQHEAKKLM